MCRLMVSPGQGEHLRVALYRELGFVGEDVAQLSLGQRIRRAMPYCRHLRRIKEISDLLSVIGWEADDRGARGVWVDMSEQHSVLAMAALQRDIEAECDALPDSQGLQRQAAEKRIRELQEFMMELDRSGK